MMEDIVVSSTESRIHVVLSPWNITDDFNRHAGVVLLSLLDHCSEPVTVHMLYDGKFCAGKETETEYTKACYQKIADKYDCTLEYHHIDMPEWMNDLKAVKRFTVGTLMRLYLPDILVDVDKIIYLDCDMVVLTDLAKLWKMPLNENIIAACSDTMLLNSGRATKKYWRRKNIPENDYFNAGFLIMNLDVIRKTHPSFVNDVLQYLKENSDLKWLDQDALNWYCKGSYLKLDSKYNVYCSRPDALTYSDDCIFHYSIRELKPWKKYNGHLDDYYWDYLIQTPWCDDKREIVKYVRAAPDVMQSISMLSHGYNGAINGGVSYKLKTAIRLTVKMWLNIMYWGGLFIKSKLRI